MATHTSSITARRRTTILLFTVAAGSVDAIVYLVAHVFTANMTGNAVLFGIDAGQGKALAATHSIIALLAFIIGIVAGAMIVRQYGKTTKWTFVRNAVLLEAILLALFAGAFLLPSSVSQTAAPALASSAQHSAATVQQLQITTHQSQPHTESPAVNPPAQTSTAIILIIVFSGLAMGLQSAVVRGLNLPGIATTYITGTITNLFAGLVHHWGHPTETESDRQQMRDLRSNLRLQAEVFLTYALAAVACGALYVRWPAATALLPVLAISAVTIYMFVRHRQLEAAARLH